MFDPSGSVVRFAIRRSRAIDTRRAIGSSFYTSFSFSVLLLVVASTTTHDDSEECLFSGGFQYYYHNEEEDTGHTLFLTGIDWDPDFLSLSACEAYKNTQCAGCSKVKKKKVRAK